MLVLGKAGHSATRAELVEAVASDISYGQRSAAEQARILRCALAIQRLDGMVSVRIRPGTPRFEQLATTVRPPVREPRITSVSAEKAFGWLPENAVRASSEAPEAGAPRKGAAQHGRAEAEAGARACPVPKPETEAHLDAPDPAGGDPLRDSQGDGAAAEG
jgi:hypothetical protein